MRYMMLSVLCVVGALELPAQVIVAHADVTIEQRETVRQRSSGLDALVTVNVENAELKTVLHLIARQAAIDVIFGDDVAKDTRTVSLRMEKQPAAEVITRTLKGTGIGFTVTQSGKVMFARQASESRSNGIIVGRVLHAKTKQPVGGATVLLDDAAKGVVSSNDGTFRISAAPGERTVRVRLIGYVRAAHRVVVSEEESVNVEILLEPSASVLDEVVVTGTVVATERRALPNPITVITAEELDRRGITRIEQLFRGEIPGLVALEAGTLAYGTTLAGSSSSKIYSRGTADLSGGSNAIKTYVDGVELADPSYLGTLDPQSIARIEVITGPQAATLYGSGAMGGVMQIFTKKGSGTNRPEVRATLKYGVLESNFSNGKTPSHNDIVNVVGHVGADVSYSVNLTYQYSGQWQPRLFSKMSGASLGMTMRQGSLTWSPALSVTSRTNGTYNSSAGIGVEFGFYRGLEDGTYDARRFDKTGFISQQRSTASSQLFSLNADYTVSRVWQHHLVIGKNQNDFALDPIAPNFNSYSYGVGRDTLYRKSNSAGDRMTLNYNTTIVSDAGRSLSSSLTAGLNATSGQSIRTSGCSATKTSSAVIGCFGTQSAPDVAVPTKDQSSGGFVQGRLGVWDRLYLTLGVRGERNKNYGDEHKIDWTPTQGIAYTLEFDKVTLKMLASYGRATRAPATAYKEQVITISTVYDPARVVSQIAAPYLRPERSRGPQGGFELYYGTLMSLAINHYHQTVDDLIEWVAIDTIERTHVTSGAIWKDLQRQYQNTAAIRQLGWEAIGMARVGPVQVKGTYSWNDSRVTKVNPLAFYRNYKPGDVFLGVPTHTASVNASFAHRGTSISIVSNYMGSMRMSPIRDISVYANSNYLRHKQYGERLGNFVPVHHPGYFKSDLAASHVVGPRVSLLLNVINLGNSFESDVGGLHPALGRQTTFGVSMRYR